ncbi:MAG: hypothetical protein VR64_23920 [Desulfatitalea sp. BRH_c12]|nr:MAG: hypothetical protein VR64_23920 [Desulfatitalea sp. BRH_c12]
MAVAVFAFAGTAQAYEVARVMTSGKINVYRNGQLTQVLQANAPLPEGALLKPERDCVVRLENVYMVARAGSEFGVHNESRPVQVAVNKGTVYFAVNQSTGQMVFHTPAGSVTTQQFRIQAAVEGTLKGFVTVSGQTASLGVIEGGAMMVSTPDGEQLITSGNQITLAQADITGQGSGQIDNAADKAATSRKIPTETLINAGVLGMFAGAAVWMLDSTSDDNTKPAPASPATP